MGREENLVQFTLHITEVNTFSASIFYLHNLAEFSSSELSTFPMGKKIVNQTTLSNK